MSRIKTWNPEDSSFWKSEGKKVASRNLWISVPALMLAFIVWQLMSISTAYFPDMGFKFSEDDIWWLVAIPGFVGATLRLIFMYMPGTVGGKNWTVISTALLLIPVIGLGISLQNPGTSFTTMAIWAAFCGIGGGNFSSSMANISYFYPKRLKGTANGINAGLGNLGVSVVQFVTPIIIFSGAFAAFFGEAHLSKGVPSKDGKVLVEAGKEIFLQNATLLWVVPIVLVTILALLFMNNLDNAKQSFREQSVIFKNKHTWIMSLLYTTCFGSFIGYSAAFAVLTKKYFPELVPFVFVGPLVGALIRPVGGWISDKIGGAIVTFYDIIVMIAATFGVMYFISTKSATGYFILFLILFVTTGIANGSTFRMIPVIFEPRQAAPVLGFTGAIAAYGAFIIPIVFKNSIKVGNINQGFYIIIAFYVISLVVCWYFYTRRNAEVKC